MGIKKIITIIAILASILTVVTGSLTILDYMKKDKKEIKVVIDPKSFEPKPKVNRRASPPASLSILTDDELIRKKAEKYIEEVK